MSVPPGRGGHASSPWVTPRGALIDGSDAVPTRRRATLAGIGRGTVLERFEPGEPAGPRKQCIPAGRRAQAPGALRLGGDFPEDLVVVLPQGGRIAADGKAAPAEAQRRGERAGVGA